MKKILMKYSNIYCCDMVKWQKNLTEQNKLWFLFLFYL